MDLNVTNVTGREARQSQMNADSYYLLGNMLVLTPRPVA